MINLKRTHYIIGLLGIIAFLLTGQYMHFALDHLNSMDDVSRLLYRSSHIYLLLSALVNLAIGVYIPKKANHVRPALQNIVSFLIVLAPILIAFGFFADNTSQNLDRSYTRAGLYAMFTAAVLLVFVGKKTK